MFEGFDTEARQLLETASAKGEEEFQRALFLTWYADLLDVLGEHARALEVNAEGLNLTFDGADRAQLLRQRASLLITLGRADEARAFVEEGWRIDGGIRPAEYAPLYARLGEGDRAREILANERLGYINAPAFALTYLALDDTDALYPAPGTGRAGPPHGGR